MGSYDNIFQTIVHIYGRFCFINKGKLDPIRSFLYKYIKQHHNYRKVVEKIMSQALDFALHSCDGAFSSRSVAKSSITLIPQRREVLFLAAHLCQKYNIKNKELIKTVFKVILSTKGTTSSWDWRWFRVLNPYCPVRISGMRETLYPYKPAVLDPLDENWITKEHVDALRFFLNHAKFRFVTNSSQLMSLVEHPTLCDRETDVLHSNEADFVDCPLRMLTGISVPLAQATQACNPELVLLFLRHGAVPHYTEPKEFWRIPHEFFPEQPLDPLMTMLNSCARWKSRGGTDAHANLDSWLEERLRMWETKQEKKALACLKMFCRAIDRLPIMSVRTGFLQLASMLETRNCLLLDPVYVETLPGSRIHSPAELQHLCRCRIRRRLKYLLRLPDGVYELPLPGLLQRYLDLLYD